MSIGKTKKEIGFNKTEDEFLKSKKIAKVTDTTNFYVVEFKKSKNVEKEERDLGGLPFYYNVTEESVSDEFKLSYHDGWGKISVSTKLIVVENNGKFRDFITNTPVELEETKEKMLDQHKYDALLNKKCIFVKSLKPINKEELGKILLKIKNFDEENEIKAYSRKIFEMIKSETENIKIAAWKYEEKLKREQYKEPTADELINYFVNKKVKR